MAEALSYAGSPFDEYLQATGAEAEELLEDTDAPPNYASSSSDAEEVPGSQSEQDTTATQEPTHLPPPASQPRTPDNLFIDRLKYALATSSLLTPRLAEALPLYPPLDTASRPPPAQDDRVEEEKRARRRVAEWGEGWESRGKDWEDRTGWESVVFLLCACSVGLVQLLASASGRRSPPAPSALPIPSTPPPTSMHATVLSTVDRLVTSSQTLDLRISRALSSIREVECIGWGLGLSDPLPPISRLESARPRVPSPLAFSPPPSYRAKPLRRTLSTSLASLSTSLASTRSTLASLDPSSLPPSLNSSIPQSEMDPPTSARDKRKTWDGGSPTTAFGGVERRSRVRLSMSPDTSSSPVSPARARPVSLTLWDLPAVEELGIGELQRAWEEVHDARRGVLWKVIALADLGRGEGDWESLRRALGTLEAAFQHAGEEVRRGVEAEFGAGGGGTFSRSAKRASVRFDAVGRQNPPSRPLSLSAASPSFPPSPRRRPLSLSSPPTNFSLATPNPSLAAPNFAPPNPYPSTGPTAALESFEKRARTTTLALRTIAAKLHVVTADARAFLEEGGEEGVERLLKTHDSIRGELESLGREWDGGRVDLRAVVRRNKVRNEEEEEGTSLDSIEDVEEELRTPPREAFEYVDELPKEEERAGAYVDEVLPDAGVEQVFEAVAGSRREASSGLKLSREERIKAIKEERRKGGVAGDGGVRIEAGMVQELKDVLQLLKGRQVLQQE